MYQFVIASITCAMAVAAWGEVRVSVRDVLGEARIGYECTGGEVVRAFALDVNVDRGRILGVTNFFVGPCTTQSQGYGIFPAAFREHLAATAGTNIHWGAAGYTPVAVAADDPAGTLPGLNSAGVTLEFGGLWNPTAPATFPKPAGVLCTLQLSEAAQVSVTPNTSRGGIVAARPEVGLQSVFVGAFVDPAHATLAITGVSLIDGRLTLTFRGGELESAPTVEGEWTGTGNTTGQFTESITEHGMRFFRVRRQ